MEKKAGILMLGLFLACTQSGLGKTIYVDARAPGGNTGASWTNAYNFLQDALAAATNGDEILVAQGIYIPDSDLSHPAGTKDRTATFLVPSGVTLRGGYAGTGETDPEARNVGIYKTQLSGDLNGDDENAFANREDNSFHVVELLDLTAVVVLDGFVITGGNANGVDADSEGGGARVRNSNASLHDCMFASNKALGSGGAMSGYNSNLRLHNCVFADNRAESQNADGGAIANWYGTLFLNRCLFMRNYARDDGGALAQNCDATIMNCIFSNNSSASTGGAIYYLKGSTKIINSCLVSNSAVHNNGGLYAEGSTEVSNCIFWANRDKYGTNERAQISGKNIEVNYCCIQGLTGKLGGQGNIPDDPFFVDFDGADDIVGTEDDDFRLLPWSPCIDAGNNAAFLADEPVDFDGMERFVDVVESSDSGSGTPPLIDMGPFEHGKHNFILNASQIPVPEGGTATFSVCLAQDPGSEINVTVSAHAGDSDIVVQTGSTLVFDSTNYSQPQPVTLFANEDMDNVNNTAYILISRPGLVSAGVIAVEVENEPYADVLLVDCNADGSNNGMSWANAFNNLQDALQQARSISEIEEIWIAQGIYTPAEPGGDRRVSFELRNGLTIKGGFAGYGQSNPDRRDTEAFRTTLSGDLNKDDVRVQDAAAMRDEPSRFDNSIRVVTSFYHATAVLDGVTIEGGYNDLSYDLSFGGGIYCEQSSLTITNCLFRYNTAHRGGAIAQIQHCNPIIRDCVFEANLAYEGAAISDRFRNRLTIDKCIFRRNFAEEHGGAIDGLESSYTFDDCQFLQNGGGAVHISRSLITNPDLCTFNNCTFEHNSGAGGGGVSLVESKSLFTNCVFRANRTRVQGGALISHKSSVQLVNCLLGKPSQVLRQ